VIQPQDDALRACLKAAALQGIKAWADMLAHKNRYQEEMAAREARDADLALRARIHDRVMAAGA
jgi:hypothetical protein